MGKTLLTKDSEFVVGEEKGLDYVMAFIFFIISLYGFTDIASNEFTHAGTLSYILLFFALPALLYMAKAKSRRVYIRINKTGIYHDEELVTNWANLLNVYISQEQEAGSFQDNFVLVVEHLKEGFDDGFRRKIPLTNTQNKSEEEVLEAVNFFWKAYTNDAGT